MQIVKSDLLQREITWGIEINMNAKQVFHLQNQQLL